jgi:hypothetical protein
MSLHRLGAWRVVLKRAAHDRIVVAAALVTIVLATTLLASGPVYADAVALSGLQRTLEDAPVRETTLQISGNETPDEAAAADRRVTSAVEDAFGPGGATVYRSARSGSYTLPALTGVPDDALTVFAAYDDLADHATLVDGEWPARETEAVLSEGAARALGLGAGDSLEVASALDEDDTIAVGIAGVYRVDDVDDPYWWASPLELQGRETVRFTTLGPLVVTREALAGLGESGSALTWRVAPTIGEIDVDDLPGLQTRLAALTNELSGDFTVENDLSGVLARAERSLLVSRSGVLVPSVQLAVLAGAALLFLAGLLAERRRVETAILRSRGGSRNDVGLLALAEGVLLAVPAVLVAPWLAVVSLQALNHFGPLADVGLELQPRVSPTAYALAVVAGLLCAGGLALPALRSATVTTAVQEQGRPRPSGIVRRAGLDLVVVAVAALAYWQLRRYQGPVVESIGGRLGIDPLLVAAPALGLLAGALLSLRIVPALAGAFERVGGAARGPVPPLGTRELARRPSRYARAAVLLTLAIAIGLFASAYSSTWLRSQEDRAAFEAGADIRVAPDEHTGAISPFHLGGAYAAVDGVTESLPVVQRAVEVSGGGEPAALAAVDTARVPQVVRVRPDLVEGTTLAEATAPLGEAPELPAIALPGEPASLGLTADADVEPLEGSTVFGFRRRATPPTLAVVLQDGDGLLHRLQAGPLPLDGAEAALEVPLADPTGAGRPTYPLSLVAVELELDAAFSDSRRGTFTLASLAADGAAVDSGGSGWSVRASELQDALTAPRVLAVRSGTDPVLTYDFDTGSSGTGDQPVTFTATPGVAEVPETIPALVTDSFLDRTGAVVGGTVSLGPEEPRLEIVGSVHDLPTLPPEEGGALVDLRAYLATTYLGGGEVSRPGEWLVDVAPGADLAVADRLRASPFSSAEVVDRVGVEETLTRDPVALGISGALTLGFVAAAVFAVVGFAVAAAVSTAERTTEFAVLRSLGLSERQLTGWLALEGGLTAALALVGGLLLGAVVAWLVLPFVSLAGEGGRPFPDVIVELPWETVAALGAGLALAVAAVLVVQLVLIRRLSIGSSLRAGGGT